VQSDDRAAVESSIARLHEAARMRKYLHLGTSDIQEQLMHATSVLRYLKEQEHYPWRRGASSRSSKSGKAHPECIQASTCDAQSLASNLYHRLLNVNQRISHSNEISLHPAEIRQLYETRNQAYAQLAGKGYEVPIPAIEEQLAAIRRTETAKIEGFVRSFTRQNMMGKTTVDQASVSLADRANARLYKMILEEWGSGLTY
jgi:hypothetical protein